MASALSPPRGPKPKGVPPSHYYESFLEKKGPCDQDYRKFWAGLQGLAICFYNSNRDVQVLEKLDLRLFSKLKDETWWGSSRDTSYHFSLVLRDQEVKFKVESLESCEMWKGFILTVVELRVPSNLTLLPGHLYMMAEVLAKEEARRAAEVPWCFLQVSRLEAQLLLERYPECGNLLLRPGGDGKDSVSVTTRQILNGAPVVKHYKVKRKGPKYVIDVEDPFSCPSLEAVVNYFVTQTKRALVPFLMEEDYEKVLGFVDSDRENGESVWAVSSSRGSGPAPHTNVPKPLPPVPVPVSSQEDRLPPLPPLPQLPDQDENYVTPIEDSLAAEYMNHDVSPSSQPVPSKPKKPAKLPAKPPKPPVVPKPGRAPTSPFPLSVAGGLRSHLRPSADLKAITSVWARKPGGSSPQAPSLVTRLGDITAELEEKLQKRRALEH
ncbi:signal-transducing adaptor protein 2 isoform X2 [Peromyscus californicus insignis]|uniref:signal-transducing adaptor protein 2 isoform X2 n=1 Tax=Peromyscus californicus insignis TaxID=564181 RepID=UPI0022A6ED40|nr:signal-transducing adaptor protein 2 isoform X2 [Peromyscus californicus insignis]